MYHLVTAKVSADGGKARTLKYLTVAHSLTESEAVLAADFENVGNIVYEAISSRRFELAGYLKDESKTEEDPFKAYFVTLKIQVGSEEKPKFAKEKYLVEAETDIVASKRMLEFYSEAEFPVEVDKVEYSNIEAVLYNPNESE